MLSSVTIFEKNLLNKKQAVLLILAGIALTFTNPLFSETLNDKQVVANSVNDFSGTQGKHGWFYGYWNQSLDVDESFNQNTDFKKFEHFGDDLVNGLSKHTDFETGLLWYVDDSQFYTSIWAKGGHAHADMELGAYSKANHWVVRRWTSSHAGEVEIKGIFGKIMPWGHNWGGNVTYQIIVDDKVLFNRQSINGEEEYSLNVKLKPNSTVDFMIGPGTAIGVVNFTGSIYKMSL